MKHPPFQSVGRERDEIRLMPIGPSTLKETFSSGAATILFPVRRQQCLHEGDSKRMTAIC